MPFPEQFPLLLASVLTGAAVALLLEPLQQYWDRLALLYVADQKQMLEKIAGDTSRVPFLMRLWGILLIAVILIFCLVLKLYLIGAAIAFLLFVFPRLLLKILLKRRQTQLRDQLVPAISIIANSVRASLAVEQAMELAAREAPRPLRDELFRIVIDVEHGVTFIDAINAAKSRMQTPGFTLFAAALAANKTQGGKISKTLDEIQRSLVENQRLERKLEADTATGKLVINVLAFFPIIFIGISYLMNPSGTALLFTTISGQAVLFVVVVLVYLGYRLGLKILDIEF